MTLKIDKDKIKSILIIQPSRIGDVVFSLPVLAGLRKLFPDAYIAWLVDDRCKELIEGNPYLDEVIVFPFKQLKKHLGGVREEVYKLKKVLKEKKFDLSIDLHGLAKSAFIVWLAKAKYRIGSASSYGMKELSYLFSKEIPPENENMHCVDRHLAVLRYLGGEVGQEKDFTIKVSDQDRLYVDTLLENLGIGSNDNLVIVQTGGGWKSRRWFPERFTELADRLIETYKCKILFTGGKPGGSPESGIIDRVMSLMEKKAYNISGLLNLKQLVALLGKVKLFVGNEAGPMHLACALNVPVVAIIGPTNPSRTGPFSKNSIVVRKPVSCAPCKERNCKKLDCMKSISVEDVMSAVGKLL